MSDATKIRTVLPLLISISFYFFFENEKKKKSLYPVGCTRAAKTSCTDKIAVNFFILLIRCRFHHFRFFDVNISFLLSCSNAEDQLPVMEILVSQIASLKYSRLL
jgi:hypothetical protein